jgi:GNAT superfamily N-acetyltransferase
LPSTTGFIRPFRRGDRSAVREICAATAWMGEPDPERIPDGWIWAEFWTRYFTDREWRNSWVVQCDRSGRVVGYLTGTADVRRFDRYAPFLLPGIVLRAVRKRLLRRTASRKAILGLLRSHLAGEAELPPGVGRDYPGTFHMNLLPEARRRGLGSLLLETYLAHMRRLGVPGVHAQPLSVNEPILRLTEKAGFRLVARTSLHAFSHVDPRPIEVCTYVMALRDMAAHTQVFCSMMATSQAGRSNSPPAAFPPSR